MSGTCPECSTTGILPDSLIPNHDLRKTVKAFINKTAHGDNSVRVGAPDSKSPLLEEPEATPAPAPVVAAAPTPAAPSVHIPPAQAFAPPYNHPPAYPRPGLFPPPGPGFPMPAAAAFPAGGPPFHPSFPPPDLMGPRGMHMNGRPPFGARHDMPPPHFQQPPYVHLMHSSSNFSRHVRAPGVCFNCQQPGHVARNCLAPPFQQMVI